MINLHLTRADDYEGVYLKLPATPAEIGEACSWLDEISRDVSSTKIVDAVSPVPNLWQYIKDADVNSGQDMAALNELAEEISHMDAREKAIFSGALDAESINGLGDVLHAADSLDAYELIPGVSSDRALGGYVVEHGLTEVEIPESVWPYLDYAAIGAAYYAEHGGAYGPGGYVKRRENSMTLQDDDDHVFDLHLNAENSDRFLILTLPAIDTALEEAKGYEQRRKKGAEAAPVHTAAHGREEADAPRSRDGGR